MRPLYFAVLALSAAIQIGFGFAFLAIPDAVLRMGGVPINGSLTGMTINLGCLVLFCGALAVQAMIWMRAKNPAGHRLADLLGVMLLLMGMLEGAHGMWVPLVGDGSRGLLLVVLAIVRVRRERAPGT